MLPTSADYDAGILASTRQIRARVTITWTDPTIDPTITATATAKNYISYPDQVADLAVDPKRKWAHLDGAILANGSYYPAPSTAQAAAGDSMGYWSSTRCDGSGNFAVHPTITIEFDPRPITSFSVAGDSAYNEYPVDFTIKSYDDTNTLLDTQTIIGNTDLYWTATAPAGLNTVAKMVLDISKWSLAGRVAKILEFYTGVSATYEGDDIATMNILEEREIADGSLPVGNISCNEMDLELQNIKIGTTIDPFFYGNTDSYLQEVLIPNRKILAEIGLVLPDSSVEWIPMGTFWSGDWSAPEKGVNVSTTARDRMEFLRKAEFKNSEVYTNETLYDLLETVLNDAKTNVPMTDLTWDIDTELQDYWIPYAYFPRQDYFTCIKQIVEACRGQAFMSRSDVLTVTGPSFAGN